MRVCVRAHVSRRSIFAQCAGDTLITVKQAASLNRHTKDDKKFAINNDDFKFVEFVERDHGIVVYA